jgi:hypothetical protein
MGTEAPYPRFPSHARAPVQGNTARVRARGKPGLCHPAGHQPCCANRQVTHATARRGMFAPLKLLALCALLGSTMNTIAYLIAFGISPS